MYDVWYYVCVSLLKILYLLPAICIHTHHTHTVYMSCVYVYFLP